MQTDDMGQTWTTAAGKAVATPVGEVHSAPLVIDYQAQGLNVYIHDLNMDAEGHPAILYLTSHGAKPGPEDGPRVWRVTSYDGHAWRTSDVCESDHNYDTGCLFRDGRRWMVVGPSMPGPQPWGSGGEIALWTSEDGGKTWRQTRQVTRDSKLNHSYVRRVVDGREPFQLFWADGNPNELSESHLYFGSPTNGRYFELPYDMTEEFEQPTECGR
jgi:hypothetical protein